MGIENGKILWRDIEIPSQVNKDTMEKALNVNLHNSFVLPGLINMHCHLSGSGKKLPRFLSFPFLTKILKKTHLFRNHLWKISVENAKIALKKGITTLRSLGEPLPLISKLQTKISEGFTSAIKPKISFSVTMAFGFWFSKMIKQ
jgi:imidazolonepropionase-like amidohydrolase